jgi:hypothetical protein
LKVIAKFFGTKVARLLNAHENRSEVHFNSVFMSCLERGE